ncbi:Uncharacterised protein [Porphyromonas cangingivalis]|nr:Uncharacterised protein [Porphyromonas cangingivalis]
MKAKLSSSSRRSSDGQRKKARNPFRKQIGFTYNICLRLPAVSLAFIGAENKDFACVHLHRTK